MAVAYQAQTVLASGTGTRSFNHTATNPAGAIVVISGGSVDETTGVTYAGVDMSRERTAANTSGETGTTSIWYLDAPTTGTQAVQISRSASNAYIAVVYTVTSATGFTEVVPEGTAGESIFSSTNTSLATVTLTLDSTAAFIAGGIYSGENALGSVTYSGGGAVTEHTNDFGNFVSRISRVTTIQTGASFTYAYTQSNDDAALAAMAVKEAAVPANYSQAAYRFYQDGTESGSTALGTQSTTLTQNVDSDVNLGVRVRLQNTNAQPGASTNDFKLQYRVNAGAWTDTGTGAVTNFNSSSLTEGAATTNRLGAGTGSFVAGKVSEDGIVDNLGTTASNYTELLYSVTLVSSSLADADSVEFRVLKNNATTNMTYTVTPTITAAKTIIKSGTDSTNISSAETSSFAQVDFTRTDSTEISSTETASIDSTVTASDTTSITSTDTGSVFATVAVSSSDSTEISSSETSSFAQVDFTRTDTTEISSSETSSFAQVDFSSTDSTQISSSETSSLSGNSNILFSEDYEGTAGAAMSTSNTEWELFNGAGTRTLESSPTPKFGSTLGRYGGAGIGLTKDTNSLPGTTNGGSVERVLFFRGYYKVSSSSPTLSRIIVFEESVANGGADVGVLRLNADRSLRLMDGTTTVGSASTHLLSTTYYTRIEMKIDQNANTIEARMWWDTDVDSASTGATNYESISGTLDTNTDMEVFGTGYYTAQGDNGYLYVEEVAVGTGDWIGPANYVPPTEKSSSDSTEISSTDSGSVQPVAGRSGPTVKSSASNNSGTGTSSTWSVTLPSGIDDGDVAYLIVTVNTGTDRGDPGGSYELLDYTTSSTVLAQKVYRLPLTASDSGTTKSYTMSAAQKWTVSCVIVAGDGGVDVEGTAWSTTTTQSSWEINAITPTVNDSLLLALHSWRRNTTGTTVSEYPTGWTESVETSTDAATAPTNGSGIGYIELTGQANTQQGAWTDGTYENNSSTASHGISLALAVKPSAIQKSSSDTTEISSTESSSLAITANISGSDTTEITSSETSQFATVERSASDTTDISTGETASIISTQTRTDATEITSNETASIQSTLSRTDSTDIGSSESSQITVLVSSADTTQISSGGVGTPATFRSAASAAIDTQTLTVAAPAGMQVGDTEILIHHWAYRSSRTEPASVTGLSSTGWTRLISTADYTPGTSTERVNVWYRTVPSGENTTSLTLAPSNFTEQRAVRMAFYSTSALSVNTTKSISVFENDADGVYQTPTASGITEAVLLHFATLEYELASATLTTDGALTEVYNSGYTSGRPFIAVGTETVSGNTSSRSFTLSATGNDGYTGLIRIEAQGAGETSSIQSTLSRTDSTEITSSETSSFAQIDFTSTDSTEITGTDTGNVTVTFPGSDATLISSSETSDVQISGAFDLNDTDSTEITSSETSNIVVLISRNDTTQITSSESASFGQVNFSTTDSTQVTSAETAAIVSTLTRTDSTDITSAETSAIQSTLSRTDATEIASSETATIQSTLSRTDTTQITSSETSTIYSTLSRTDSTEITSSETAASSGTVTTTDTTLVTSADTSSLAITTAISSSDSTEISSSETSQIDLGGTQLIRHEERFNGGTSGTTMTSGNTIFTLFPGTGTMEFSDEHPIQGGTGAKFVSTTAAQGKRGKVEGLLSRRTWYARFYYYKSGNPSAVNRMMIFETAANASPPGDDIAGIREEANGNLTLFNGSSWATGNPVTSLANGWHRIELKVDRDGTTSTIRVWSGANLHSTGTADQEVSNALTDNGNEISVVGIGNYNAVNQTRHFEDFAVGDQGWIGPSGNIDISATDSTQISSSETSAITVPITSADTTLVSSTETAAIVSSQSDTDTTEVGSSESSALDVTLSRTDATEISSAESSALQSNLSRADTTEITSAETSTIQSTISRADTTDITSTETSSIQSTLSRSDSTNITSAETSSFGQINFSASDSTEISSADVGSPTITFPGTDATLISSSETSDIQATGGFNLSSDDATEISSSETSSVLVIVNTSDTTNITSTESSSFATVAFTRTDSTNITSAETSQFATVVRSATDSTEITGSDSSSFGTVAFTRTDTTDIISSETSSFGQVNFSASDTTQITVTETSTPLADFPGTDSTLISSSETSDVQASGGFNLSSDDTTNITSSETSAVVVIINTQDTTDISSSETVSVAGTVNTQDTTDIGSTESVSFGQVDFSASDSTQISSTDAGQPVADFPGTDTTLISSSETSDVQISGGSNISGSDSTSISSGETSSLVITAFITGSDSTNITSTDTSSFGQVNFTSTDSTEITSTESATPLAIMPGTDATLISSSETSDVQASGGFDLNDSDTTDIGSSETSDIIATVAVSSSDSTNITSSESSAFAQVDFTRTDSTNITSTESSSVSADVASSDSTQITSTDSGTPVADFPGTDTTLIGSSETSQVELVGNVPVSTSDSTNISSSETSAVSVTVGRADATQITSTETSASSGTVYASDTTEITSSETVAFNDQDIIGTDATEISSVDSGSLFILIVVSSDDSTEISSTDTQVIGALSIGEITSRTKTDHAGRGVSGRGRSTGHVSTNTSTGGGVGAS